MKTFMTRNSAFGLMTISYSKDLYILGNSYTRARTGSELAYYY